MRDVVGCPEIPHQKIEAPVMVLPLQAFGEMWTKMLSLRHKK
jgi:hypothetical protein